MATTIKEPRYVVTAVNNLTGVRETISKPHSRWKTEVLLTKAMRDTRRHHLNSSDMAKVVVKNNGLISIEEMTITEFLALSAAIANGSDAELRKIEPILKAMIKVARFVSNEMVQANYSINKLISKNNKSIN